MKDPAVIYKAGERMLVKETQGEACRAAGLGIRDHGTLRNYDPQEKEAKPVLGVSSRYVSGPTQMGREHCASKTWSKELSIPPRAKESRFF